MRTILALLPLTLMTACGGEAHEQLASTEQGLGRSCDQDAVTTGDPTRTAPSTCPVTRPRPDGGPCRWADECYSGYCVVDHDGDGVCSPLNHSVGPCNSVLGTSSGYWTDGFYDFSCVGSTLDGSARICAVLEADGLEWPACASGFGGESCQLGDPCVTNAHCASGYCFKSYPETAGVCTIAVVTSCPPGMEVSFVYTASPDPLELCVPSSMVCN